MKILFVLNNYYIRGNGLSASARRTVKELKAAGEDVRILSGCDASKPGQHPEFPLKEFHFPIFQPLIESEGFCFANGDVKMIEKAIRWADVVHLEENFVLQLKAIRIAKRLGKPLTATFHLFPENIFYSLGMGKCKWVNQAMLNFWRNHVYNQCVLIQCPSQKVYDRLKQNDFSSELRVFSNGLVPETCRRPELPPADYLDPERPLEVVCVGRFAAEKDQVTLLKAIPHSQFARRIHLTFAGNGPQTKMLHKKAAKLYANGIVGYEPSFVFLDHDGLRKLTAGADLCIHCAILEIEGLSIMEAMQQAAVPIIADGPYTGTTQFALDEHSLFPAQDPQALAERIDYWLSRPEERWEQGKRYAASMKPYNIARSVEQLVKMFQDAIDRSSHVEETA